MHTISSSNILRFFSKLQLYISSEARIRSPSSHKSQQTAALIPIALFLALAESQLGLLMKREHIIIALNMH